MAASLSIVAVLMISLCCCSWCVAPLFYGVISRLLVMSTNDETLAVPPQPLLALLLLLASFKEATNRKCQDEFSYLRCDWEESSSVVCPGTANSSRGHPLHQPLSLNVSSQELRRP